ncbi:SpoIIE family protein phosphatase [Streptomyces sp. NPDC058665]|uniref:ATP-binding SpoIIE family protein phosphatase n=1 Tax=Streptomyces sp. NPDC058665 TaxID=3346586 RepID=UPI00365F48F7
MHEATCAWLRTIMKAGEELAGSELSAFTLDAAVTESGGLGGMVHLRVPGTRRLVLVAVHGLARTMARDREWAELTEGDPSVPARATALRVTRWTPGDGRGGTVPALPGVGGLLAVPLLPTTDGGDGAALGALSVLAAREPPPPRRAAVEALAAWAGLRLRHPDGAPADGPAGPVAADAPVARTLRQMTDALFTVDRDWRLTFVSRGAERLLGGFHTPLGRVLWDVLADLGVDSVVPDLRARYLGAVADAAPVSFDIHWPTDRLWYRMRLVPVVDGLAVYATDITERRLRESGQAAAERAAAQRTARVTELTTTLAEALTMNDVVNAIAQRMLPPFGASGFAVQLIEGNIIRIAGAVGYGQDFLDTLDRSYVEEVSPVSEVYHSRRPVFIDSPEEYIARYPSMGWRPSAAAKSAWAFLPLLVSGRAIGCQVVSFAEPRHLNGEERALLTALSGLTAQAIERARLYDAEHNRAKELQRGLLPRGLPALRSVTAAARYLPASEGIEVGGDWYDVIPLSGARVALVVGDVMGHGLAEAATMGRLRTAVHTLADLDLSPADLLTRLNDLVSELGDDFYATCLYAVYDPVTRRCVFARAGHPPPAVVCPGKPVRFPDLTPDPPLGAALPPFETVEIELPEGSLLVLYTDGLVESVNQDIHRGMRHLASALSTASSRPGAESGQAGLERVCDEVLAELLPEKQRTADDAALLIARTHALAPGDVAVWSLPDGPIAAGEGREHVREQLDRWDLEPLAITAELLVSELVGNAVRHGKGPFVLRLLRGDRLICEVSDTSPTTPRIRRASETDEGGRGLQLIAALSQRWGTRSMAEGKCIWTEQPLP